MPAPGARAPAHVIPLRHPHLIDTQQPSAADSALQNTAAPSASTINPSNFDGITANGYAPPDGNGSAGDTQFVQIVNVEYAVYDKVQALCFWDLSLAPPSGVALAAFARPPTEGSRSSCTTRLRAGG